MEDSAQFAAIVENEVAQVNPIPHLVWSKSEIKTRLKKSRNWKKCGVQLSLEFVPQQESLLMKIYQLRIHFLFEDTYRMIFSERIKCNSVLSALKEFLEECGIENDFGKILESDLSLLTHCITQHSRCNQDENPIKLLESITNQA